MFFLRAVQKAIYVLPPSYCCYTIFLHVFLATQKMITLAPIFQNLQQDKSVRQYEIDLICAVNACI